MKEIIKDLKELRRSNAQKDLQAEIGYSYEDMYDLNYLNYLKSLCNKYNILFVENEIDWEWCNYIHNIQASIESRLVQRLRACKKEITDDLNYIYFVEGKHSGKWMSDDNPDYRLDIAKEFLEIIERYATKYSIKFPAGLSNYGFNDYSEKYYLMDMKGNEICLALKTTLRDKLLNELEMI